MKTRFKVSLIAILSIIVGFSYAKADSGDVPKSQIRYQAEAQSKDKFDVAQSEYFLGSKFYNGSDGEKQDFAKAIGWYQKAADHGSAKAQYSLAYMYEKGKGVRTDLTEAFKWFLKAAENGNADAQDSVGHFYQNGRSVKIDYKVAAAWYR